jgi:high affinity sulfate transporter 1
MRAWVPAIGWLRNYRLAQLRPDVVAGITLAAYLIPGSIGDASLANLPPEAGLYACLFSGLLFWLFCSSRHTAVTVTSAISLLLGSTLGEIAGGDSSTFAALAAATALLVSLIAFTAWVVRAGVIVNFVSESVMVGFKAGVALVLAGTQLPKLFGVGGAHGDFFETATHFVRHVQETNPASLALGLGSLAVLVLGKFLWKNKPIALVVVIGAIAAASLWDLGALGVKLLGEVPQGVPAPALPRAIDWSDADAVRRVFNELLPLALACFLLGAVESAAIGRMFSAKHGARFDSNQEFLALAAANLAAGLGRGYPVSGGMSQSLVNEAGGAKTPLSGLVASLLVLLVVAHFSHLLRALPQPALAAIVLMAIAGLFDAAALMELWRMARAEFFVAVAALLGVLASGLLRGVLIGAVLSLVLLLRAAARPHVAFLGRIPGTQDFSDLARHPENEAVPDVVIIRPESSLYYFNIDHVCDAITVRLRGEAARPLLLVLDLSNAPSVDLQSANTLLARSKEWTALGASVRIVGAHASVRDALRARGFEARFGRIGHDVTLSLILAEFRARSG